MDAVAPVVKWAGSKRALVPELLARLPRRFGRYFEPFVGSGALFFALRPERAVLGDLNRELVDVYRAIAADPEPVIRRLRIYQRRHSAAHYYRLRDRWNAERSSWDLAKRASTFLYFNKTCFNGLWRVNAGASFNVPLGRYANPRICDAEALRAAHVALRDVELRALDYRETLRDAAAGDLVYIDSPHHPRSATSSFTSYTAGAFDGRDQAELAGVARELHARGCHVVLSNADVPTIRTLYARGFTIDRVRCPRLINATADRRGAVDELIISARPLRRQDGRRQELR